MNIYSRLFSCVLATALLLSLIACAGNAGSTPDRSAEEADTGLYTVGICQLVQHSAHDEATRGFMDALNEALPNQVTFISQTASNDIAACSGIVSQFIAEEVDLILANATPALQIASAATAEIPILGTSITDFAAALDLKSFENGISGGNVSGTSDLAPLDKQADMVAEWFPDAGTIGMLYCSSEANSRHQAEAVAQALEAKGYGCKHYAFTDSNDLPSVLEGAISNCDVLYVPTDNTVATNASIIDNICRPAGVPVIGGERGICAGCTVATLSISYYEMGRATGVMAARILTGQADISTMPVEYADYDSLYNPEICADLGLTPPSDVYLPLDAE